MTFSPRLLGGSLSPYNSPQAVIVDDPMHAVVGRDLAFGEAAARAGSVEAASRAGYLSSQANASSHAAAFARADAAQAAMRTVDQGFRASDATAREHAAGLAHHSAAVNVAAAGSELAGRNIEFRAQQGALAAAEGVLGNRMLSREVAGRNALERDVHSAAAVERAASLEAIKRERALEADAMSARAAIAGSDADHARMTERAVGAVSHETHAAAAISRTRASQAEAQAQIAERKRAELAAAAANAAAAAREATARERAACTALACADRDADAARHSASQARADAASVEQQARSRAMQHGSIQLEAANASRRAIAENARAAASASRAALAERDSRVAAVSAVAAARDSEAARVEHAIRMADERVAMASVDNAHSSLRRSAYMLDSAGANLSNASAREAVARTHADNAVVHASIERARHFEESRALDAAHSRERLASAGEMHAHTSSRLASMDALRAHDVANRASLTRAIHDSSPRRAYYDVPSEHPLSPRGLPFSLSPSALSPTARLAASPRSFSTTGSPILDAKLRSMSSPIGSPHSRFY